MGITKYAHAKRAMHKIHATCIYIHRCHRLYKHYMLHTCTSAMLSSVLRGEREVDHLKLGASDVVKRSIYFPNYHFSVKLRTAFHGGVHTSLKVTRPPLP